MGMGILRVWASRRLLSRVVGEDAPPQGDQPVAPTGEGTEGEGMEGPGRLRRKTATPVPMGVVRHSGCSTSKPALRQPRTSEGMWKRREKLSRWGLDHQKCSTTPRDGSVDP